MFDRDVYFDSVRDSLFAGSMTQQQVDGQNFILDTWEKYRPNDDLRWLAYFLATAMHETSSTMWPIEEYGKGQGMEYGTPDPVTGQTYYGRGFVQLTWKSNYQRADDEILIPQDMGSCVADASKQLDPMISGATGYRGCMEGWFRSDSKGRQTFIRYFDDNTDDAYGAREIINGDKTKVPSWSNGVSIGNLIKGYHQKFLAALNAANVPAPAPEPEPETEPRVLVYKSPGVSVEVRDLPDGE
jgi:hypothetical protein